MNKADVQGAVARGWCAPENEQKIMDPDLACAIADSVLELHIENTIVDALIALMVAGPAFPTKNDSAWRDGISDAIELINSLGDSA